MQQIRFTFIIDKYNYILSKPYLSLGFVANILGSGGGGGGAEEAGLGEAGSAASTIVCTGLGKQLPASTECDVGAGSTTVGVNFWHTLLIVLSK